jgi:DNA-binding Lrp family transcriptional regulator
VNRVVEELMAGLPVEASSEPSWVIPPPEHPPDEPPRRATVATVPAVRTSWTAVDLLAATFPEPRWAVPGILAEGLNLLAGAPKLGKSWLGLNVCAAVAAGGRALGRVPVTRGDALYLALEDPPRRLQQRLTMTLDGGQAPPGLSFETAWPCMSDGGAEQLDTWLAAHPGCRLVVVDVLAKVRGTIDDRASRYDADYAAMNTLKALADHHGVAMLVLHHTRKAASDDFLDTVSGTHGLAGAADAVLVMRRARNSADAVLHLTGRDVEEAEHAMRFDPTSGTWTLLDGPAGDYDLSDTRRRILTALRDFAEPLGPTGVAEVTGLSVDVTKQRLREMAEAGQLGQRGRGQYIAPIPLVTSITTVTFTPSDTAVGDGSDGSDGAPVLPL